MHALIVSLTNTIFDGEISSLTIKTKLGEITILPHHRPLITQLVAGTAHLIDDTGQKKELIVTGGFLEVLPINSLRLLLD